MSSNHVLCMLYSKRGPAVGVHTILDDRSTVVVSLDFAKLFSNGFGPGKGLHEKAEHYTGEHNARVGNWLLNRELIRAVAKAHRRVKWALGRKRHTSDTGQRCPCWYGYVDDKLVAMAAPMVGRP